MFNNFQSNANIYDALNRACIKYKGQPNHKGWLKIICPFHNDHNYGNCSVNVNSGHISCFVCGKHHIRDLVNVDATFTYKPEETKEIKKTASKLNPNLSYNFIKLDLNPNDFYYTKQRGFTKEFCEQFGIVRCFSFPYQDYFAVPIIDSKKDIYECEFRKLMEYEYLFKYYQNKIRGTYTFKQLKERFKYDLSFYSWELETCEDDILRYLLDNKVKYESGAKLKNTLWNIDNIDFNKPLYLVEGIGSICKIWTSISKNVTCTFGSKLGKVQFDYLRKFKQIILIPDRDEAGFNMVKDLFKANIPIDIIDISYEDTDEEYVSEIKNTNIMKDREYLAKYYFVYEGTKSAQAGRISIF